MADLLAFILGRLLPLVLACCSACLMHQPPVAAFVGLLAAATLASASVLNDF